MALNASARNCSVKRSSRNRKFLNSDRSALRCPGLRTSGKVRPTLPKVNGGAKENTDVLNHCFSRESLEPPLTCADWPLLLGLWPGDPSAVLFCVCVRITGVPVWKVNMPLVCQPPKINCQGSPALFMNLRPLPRGKSYTVLMTKRLETS